MIIVVCAGLGSMYKFVPNSKPYFSSLLNHIVTLLAGCGATVALGLIQKYALRKPLSIKWEIAILSGFVFFAGFQAWQDQYEKASKTNNQSLQITNQVNIPPITVPPATVIVQEPNPRAPSDLTGIMQVEQVQPVKDYNVLDAGRVVGFNIIYENVGSQPVHDSYHVEALGFALAGPEEEQKVRNLFETGKKQKQKEIRERHMRGDDVAINAPVYRSVTSATALTRDGADGIMTGSIKLYLLIWSSWRDSHNQLGKFEVCYWLQPPQTRELTVQNAIWHTCTTARDKEKSMQATNGIPERAARKN